MSGLLGKAALSAATYTVVATNGTDVQTVNIRLVNRNLTASTNIRLAVCPSGYVSGAPADADYIEPPDLLLSPGAILEDIAIVLSAGEKIVAYATAAQVTVRVHGL